MINNSQRNKLIANWGEKADSLACYAEIRVFDPLSEWQCYIFAMNPRDEDEIACLIKTHEFGEVEICEWSMKELEQMYNSNGEGVQVDREYRPKIATQILKQLKENQVYG